MKGHGALFPEFWTGRTGKRLRKHKDARILATHLISGSTRNMLGLYYVPIPFITHETGLTQKEVEAAFDILIEEDFCRYDKETEFVFVVNMVSWQIGPLKPSDHNVSWVNKVYDTLQENPYLGEFFDMHHESLHLVSRRESKGLPRASEGLAKGLQECTEGLAKPNVYVNVSVSSLSSIEVVKEPKIESFSPEDIVTLWNDVAQSLGLPKVRKLTDKLVEGLKKAMKDLPKKEDWEELFAEIAQSSLLQGRAGDGTFSASLGWLLKHKRGEAEPFYMKTFNGEYRGKNRSGFDNLTRNNMEAAEQALINRGVYENDRIAITEGIRDGKTIREDHCGTPDQAGDVLWADAEYTEDSDLPGEAVEVYGGRSDRGDYLGDGQSGVFPDDSASDYSDRG